MGITSDIEEGTQGGAMVAMLAGQPEIAAALGLVSVGSDIWSGLKSIFSSSHYEPPKPTILVGESTDQPTI